jgi:ATPase subunit of ABC transporter with duplicated ATPase domains
MSIVIQKISYIHPDNVVLFNDISCVVNKGEKVALVGLNGSGKSTLLKMLSGSIAPMSGNIQTASSPYYIPQHFGQYDQMTVAEALRIKDKLYALHAILQGDASMDNFTILNDDWTIEERSLAALSSWRLDHIALEQPFVSLSGGEKTKVFLSRLQIHTPEIVLMDEPTNHLDWHSREELYQWIEHTNATLIIVSHDITLLRLLPETMELEKDKITVYGGNYDFYKEQKEIQLNALQASLEEKEKELRLAKKIARESIERKQKHESRGKKLSEKKGISRMGMNTLKDKAEKSGTKLKDIHANKMSSLSESIDKIRAIAPDSRKMKINFNSSNLHQGKILIKAELINYAYTDTFLWCNAVDLIIHSGDRILIQGDNGSGKTTLLKILIGQLTPTTGRIERADFNYIYIDQEYSLIQNELTVYEQAQQFNTRQFQEHEIKMMLNRYLFSSDTWDKSCSKLSGGEKMRLLFCCLMIGNQTPDLFILDEPTNNLDIQSVEIITSVINEYSGTLLLISHDRYFIEEVGIIMNYEL